MKNIFLSFLLFLNFLAFAQNPLMIPPTLSGTNINLNLQYGTHQFFPGQITQTMGANGDILGPTLILNQGDFVNFSVNNQLNDDTTIHWHGMHVSAINDGGPHTVIAAGTTWTPAFTILDKAATYWYHPHLHTRTDLHVSKGIAGLIIVKDQEEAALDLPRTYGVDDIPLVIQTKSFDSNNQIVNHSNSDTVVMANATIDPYIDLPAQVVRFRILNGSSQRVFNLGLSNNENFYLITTDGGLLNAPLQTTRLQMAPGERAEILIDLSGRENQTLSLKSYASELPNGIYGATAPGMNASMPLNGYNPNPLNGNDFDILQINVVAPTTNPVTSIPNTLASLNPIPEADANTTRTLTFSPASPGFNQLNGEFLINNTSFDMNVINYTIPLDNVEIWELRNQSAIAHPFHIHDVQFYILDRNGNPPPATEQGRKDVVLVKPQETVRFITKFETFADDAVPYMYHCHMLTHEDGGMMGQFVVHSTNAIKDDSVFKGKVYPNPSSGNIHIEAKEAFFKIQILDLTGRPVFEKNFNSVNQIEIKYDKPGMYVMEIYSGTTKYLKKLIIR